MQGVSSEVSLFGARTMIFACIWYNVAVGQADVIGGVGRSEISQRLNFLA